MKMKSDNRMKVCWYCEKWQPGGIQAVQVNLLEHMDLKTLDFHIIVSEDETDLFDERLEALGVRRTVSLKEHYDSPGRRVFANILAMRAVIKNGKYDIVHFNVCHGVELAYVFWAWLYRVPVRIIHCRNNDIGAGGRSRSLKILCHKIGSVLFRNCGNVKLANSDLAAVWLFGRRQYAGGKVRILRNGIDAERYAYDEVLRRKMRMENGLDGRFVVGHIGHFNYQKNHEFLLQIFTFILKKNPSAVLLLVGSGERKEDIRKKAEELGIEKDIVFYGVTEDVPAVLNMMDVFVFPSRFEGFGNVLIEAQASGLKCFASEGVIPESVKITDNLEWISLNTAPDIWAEEILKVSGDCSRKSCVRNVTEAGYDITNMAEELEKIYRLTPGYQR